MKEIIKFVTFDVTPIVCVRVIQAEDTKEVKRERKNIRLSCTMMFQLQLLLINGFSGLLFLKNIYGMELIFPVI